MDYNISIKILVLISFLAIYAIEDIINQKVPNFLILFACFFNFFLNIFFNESIWGSLFIYIPLFLILILYWKKGYIGGGDLKSIIVILYFTNFNSSISICLVIGENIPDIIEFFIFFFIFLAIKKPNPISLLFETPYVYKFKSEKYTIIPYFFISYLFTLLF